jgi:hypothetical protein
MGIWLKPFALSQIRLIIFSSPLKTNELFRKIVENRQLAGFVGLATRPAELLPTNAGGPDCDRPGRRGHLPFFGFYRKCSGSLGNNMQKDEGSDVRLHV